MEEAIWDQKEMPITEHLRELRNRLLISMATVGVIAVVLFWPSQFVIRSMMRHYFGGLQLHAFGPADVILTELKFSVVGGIVIGLPVLLTQLWLFVVPAVHPRTRRMVYSFVVPSVLLAALGLAFAHFVVIPRVIAALLRITDAVATPTFGVASTLNFVIVLLALFAIIFQTPIVLIGMARLGRERFHADALPPACDLRILRRRRARSARRQSGYDGAVGRTDVRALRDLDLDHRAAGTALETVVTAAVRGLYADFVRTFGSVLFAVCLFLVWGVLTLLGVVIDQGRDPSDYFASYAAPTARAILRLNLDNVYHSPWYVGIIGLILTSLAVCTFKRVIPARLPALRPVKIDAIPLHARFETVADADTVRSRLAAFFTSRGWRVRERIFGGTEWSFADKHNWARRGVLVAHAGFVILAAGTTLYWARGFSGELALLDGQTSQVPKTGAVIRLDDFAYRIAPTQTKSGMVYQPIDYVSHVTVSGKDGVRKNMTVRVNHPIDIDDTLYYQASYGFGMRFAITHDGRRDAALSGRTLLEGDSFDIPGTQRSVLYERFAPTVDKQSGMPTADPRVNNPAVVLGVSQGGAPVGEALVPLRTWIDLGDGWRLVPQKYVMYSGFQYRHDPGVPLVGIGAFVLLAGLIISFYFVPARLYVRVDDAGERGSSVGLAATTVKGYDVFESEFARLVVALKANGL